MIFFQKKSIVVNSRLRNSMHRVFRKKPQLTEIKAFINSIRQRFYMPIPRGFRIFHRILIPKLLVDSLDEIFLHLESIINKYEIKSIKTIGDAIMCVGGYPRKDLQIRSKYCWLQSKCSIILKIYSGLIITIKFGN